MKAYIASHERFLAHNTAELIASNGVEITSRWHSKDFLPTSNHTEDECIAIAVEDVEDISRADILVLIARHVARFNLFADAFRTHRFRLTPIGCGLAGYKPEQIAPMFKGTPDNVIIPEEFKPWL